MTVTPSSTAESSPVRPNRRFAGLLPAVVIGLPLAGVLIALVHLTPLANTDVARYLKHPAQYTEVILFSAAVGLLLVKLIQTIGQRFQCARQPLALWDGRPLPVSEAPRLLAAVQALPHWCRSSALARRTTDILSYLCRRGSAVELDDHLRDLADADAEGLETSYGLIKIITWAIPILGFLGTVLGITKAIAGVNPEVLEKNLNSVTDGLAEAFDTTASALALTMIVMFFSFVVEKLEQALLRSVDDYSGQHLAHRFERASAEAAPVLEMLRQQGRVLLEGVEHLVQRQAAVWTESLQVMETRQATEQQRLTAALETAFERSLQNHAHCAAEFQQQATAASGGLLLQLAEFQEAVSGSARLQQTALERLSEAIAGQARVLAALQTEEQHLVRLQENLDRNLNLLANAETLQQAVHMLTGAVHLLTARVSVETGPFRLEGRPPGSEKKAA